MLEINGVNFASDAIELVGPVEKTPNKPGDIHHFIIRTRSGHQHTALFGTKLEARAARDSFLQNWQG
jgi:hypothetical protein